MVTNGGLSNSQLTDLKTAPGEELERRAAASWDRMHGAMRTKHGWKMGLTDSYRSLADQRSVFLSRYKPHKSGSGPFGDVRWYNGTRYARVSGSPAAIPGTSNHGLGKAIDVSGVGGFKSTRYRWLTEMAPHYGWSNNAGKKIGEAWHWEYTQADDESGNGSSPRPVKVTVSDIKALQRAVHTPDDGYWGKHTYHSVVAVREISHWGGREFPFGQKVAQRAIGRPQTGKWTATDDKVHTEVVKKLQRILGTKDDGFWGTKTESKFQGFRRAAKAMNK